MLPYNTLFNIDRKLKIPLYLQICNGVIELINNETIQVNDALPSTRKLSKLLLINRNTVNLAYDELISQGWATTVDRKGVFVTENISEKNKKDTSVVKKEINVESPFIKSKKFDKIKPFQNVYKYTSVIDDGLPDVRLAPIDQLMAEYRSISKRSYGKNFLKYSNAKGSENLRTSLTKYLSSTRGLNTTSENIMITSGNQMSLYLTAQLLINLGDIIAVGSTNDTAANDTFTHAGGKLLLIPIDEFGMDVDHLEMILNEKVIKAVHVIPHHHFPTTVTMTKSRRDKLLFLANKYSFFIIEDDFDFEYEYENRSYLPMASMDKNNSVVYLGSFSNIIAQNLRIGFLSGPLELIEAASNLRTIMDRQGDTLMEEAFAALFDSGEMSRYFRKTKKIYKERRDVFCNILMTEFTNKLNFDPPNGGFAVWTKFDRKINPSQVVNEAKKRGLYIGNEKFIQDTNFPNNYVRLGFASLEQSEMEKALKILNKSIC